ncbi:MAG: FAD-dependent oxidoreductase, partial [Candidatus Latescibacteria bacterium]|nr:FAD-dependent oxidoreductase [Candidatus Latescibacterota bacterium]
MREIIEPERKISVVREVDVVVVGGGPAGFIAAVTAARNGARTLLIERYGFLGGMATSALVGPFGLRDKESPVVEGIPREFLDRLEAAGGALRSYEGRWEECGFDPEVVKYIADQMVEEAGAELFLHSFTCNTILEDDRIKAVIIESKSGRQAITGEVFIDATGDGDIAALSGVPYEKGRKEDGLLQPMTLMYRLGNVNMASIWNDEKALSEKMKEARGKGEVSPYRVCFGSPGSTIRKSEISVNTTRLYGDGTKV